MTTDSCANCGQLKVWLELHHVALHWQLTMTQGPSRRWGSVVSATLNENHCYRAIAQSDCAMKGCNLFITGCLGPRDDRSASGEATNPSQSQLGGESGIEPTESILSFSCQFLTILLLFCQKLGRKIFGLQSLEGEKSFGALRQRPTAFDSHRHECTFQTI